MGTITATGIITKARRTLQDTDSTLYRWSDSELLGWLNSGQRDIVQRIPAAASAPVNVQLSAGIEQSLPAGYHRIIRPLMNMGTDGTTVGRAITATTFDDMTATDPSWTEEKQSDVTQQVMPSENKETYFVYPPSDGTNYIRMLLAYLPGDITDPTDTIAVDDEYANALLYYILYAAFLRDAEETANATRAGLFLSAYKEALGIEPQQGE